MSLFRVVVDKLFDAGLDDADLGEDLVGGGRPDEWSRVGVPVVDVVAYLVDQNLDGAEGAAADRLASDVAEPDFDLVEPLRADRGEVEGDVRVLLQPGLDVVGAVRRQVV